MSCFTCPPINSDSPAIVKAIERAREYMQAHNEPKRAIVKQTVNGAYTHLAADDPRIGGAFEFIQLVM